MNIFQRAHNNLPLSPTERAFLKLVYTGVASAVLTGITAVVQYVVTPGHTITWQVVVPVFAGAFGVSLFETGRKYITAHSDGPLGTALTTLSGVIQKIQTENKASEHLQNTVNQVNTTSTSV